MLFIMPPVSPLPFSLSQNGLYSSFLGSFVYAVFGTSNQVAVGPSVIVSILTAQYGTGRSPVFRDPTYAIIIALFAGVIQLGLGLLRLGQLSLLSCCALVL